MRKFFLYMLLLSLMLFLFGATIANADDQFSATKISDNLKHYTKEEVAGFIYKTASQHFDNNKVNVLMLLLDNKEIILNKDPYYSSAKIQVRDIAFVCLEEMTGESFLGNYKGKEIITYFSNDGTPFRFTIPAFSDGEYAQVKNNIKYWFTGYNEGLKEKSP